MIGESMKEMSKIKEIMDSNLEDKLKKIRKIMSYSLLDKISWNI
jgi:hypothetical protein